MLIIHNGTQTEPLQYFKDFKVKRRVNGERSLSFILLSTDENYNLVETDNIIEYKGQQYRIIKEVERSKGVNSVKSVQCLHVLFDAINNDVEGTLNGSQTIQQVMSFIFSNTSYTYDIVDSFNSVTLEDWGSDNSLALFQDALNLFGAEFDVNNTHITIKQQIGNTTDFQFRYKHNIKTIEKNVEKVGKDVRMSIKLSFAELKKAGFDYEVANCGDTVYTIYEPMNINVTTRIVEYEEYPLEPLSSKVTLANFKDNITDIMAQFSNTQKRFNKIVDNNDKVRANYLDEATKRATEAMNNALTELEFPEGQGLVARDPIDANKFVGVKSNGIYVVTDGVNVKEAITADGFVLTAGVIGQLKANNIDVSGLISAINDEGSTYIDGGKITITNNTDFQTTDSKATSAKTLTDNWKHPTNTTEIDGGKIKTYSIASDKISTTSLSAISADLGTVTAGTINGVTLDVDTFIDVGTDAYIGNMLYLGNWQGSGTVRGIDFDEGKTRIQTNGDGLLFDSLGYFVFANGIKSSVSETGFCGVGARQESTETGPLAGTGVNFKTSKTYTPSGVSMSPTSNTASYNVTNLTDEGFWLYVNGTGIVGDYPYWRGYYTC